MFSVLCSRSQKMNSAEEKLLQIQTAIVELLIRNASNIGVVSESLSQRTALMTECFGTEDELEASDDNTLEDSKDMKDSKKKRRKRSSSLQGLDFAFFTPSCGNGNGLSATQLICLCKVEHDIDLLPILLLTWTLMRKV